MKNSRIELFTIKGCEPCDDALEALVPFAKEHDIPLHIIPLASEEDSDIAAVPTTCVIKEVKGISVRKCIKGFDDDLVKDVEELLETL